ncbi:hypothetical protein PLESTB_001821200 [Pleodorina starrii]|uniref:FAD-dependent oxidoreductase 2 FAD-binding domain-containing protein n=1 Tax=Pleodorina starrii TaxID=330485 RepID=A0A9W6FAL7_9CHLO|nr:hypothetical protein PLESTB_001821200 [Pleodorina starrii]
MRRVSSSQQNRSITIGTEPCMQRQQGRGSPSPRATSHAHRARPWLLVLLASLCGFGFLIGLWSWLPPSTLLGVTAQAQQAQQRAQAHRSAQQAAATGSDFGKTVLRDSGSEASQSAAGVHSVAAGSSLVRQAQQQLQQQKQQRQHDLHTSGRGSFRGGAGSSSSSSSSRGDAMSSHPHHHQQQAGADSAPAVPPPSAQVVVVGGGLAGLVAALQAAECLEAAAAANHTAASPGPSLASPGCLPTLCGGGSVSSLAASAPSYSVDVLLVEKMPSLGGNSAKASSGINALNPEGGDSEELFRGDVTTSGGGGSRSELVERLVRNSTAALSFLAAHGASLTGVTRLGGHSVSRTRTVSGGANVGWVLMSALMEAVKKQHRIKDLALATVLRSSLAPNDPTLPSVVNQPPPPPPAPLFSLAPHPPVQVLEGYALRSILTAGGAGAAGGAAAGSSVTGVELSPAGGPDSSYPVTTAPASSGASADTAAATAAAPSRFRVASGAVVLATGGFAANKALLKTVAPEAADLATTNGPWARGESLDLAAAAGAALVGLQDVQFLAPEKLRGVGGLLLDLEGSRFVDELARRDVVAGAMMGLPGRVGWMLLGRDAGTEYGAGALEFYCKRGLMVKAETLSAAAAAMGVPEARLRQQLSDYSERAARLAAGEGYPADPFGKRVFPHPPDPDQQLPLYLAQVTPVVHYTMGGVAINERAEVLMAGPGGGPDGSGAVIKGLYAAGEVSGGLHGRNRLGGNSLLECAVFGRIAGAQAASCSAR